MASSNRRYSAAPLVLSLLALQSLTQVEAADWDPTLKPRNNDHLIAKRHDRALPRAPRLAKRQTTRPGQPLKQISDDLVGGFEIIGESGVSGQQLFLGTETKVYIIDKVENNPATVNGHPAWATEYDLLTDQYRPMDVVTNSFCAGGGLLGDGRWLNVGGNKAVDPLGVDAPADSQLYGNNTYANVDGGNSLRILAPGDGSDWQDARENDIASRRWYPTLETLADGRMIIIGGNSYGGFVNDGANNNPTYEFYPADASINGGGRVEMELLKNTLPANLYPITHLIPTDPPRLLININLRSVMFDWINNDEGQLPPVPKAVRTYPASAATFMLPMRVSDQWLASVLYCGGSDLQPDQWTAGLELINTPASASCIKMSPEVSAEFEDDEDLPQGRVMGNAILLPDGKVWLGNGANTGVAGYGADAWTNQDSYADSPLYLPAIYDRDKPFGERWSSDGLKESTVARMYHSTATLLPDGSVFVTGSNPHPDYEPDAIYPSEYRVERFYPPYYNQRRPEPENVPTTLGYGGQYFEMHVDLKDLFDNLGNLKTIKIMVMKTGFSTHGINFGMRAAELDYTYTVDADNSGATLHVSQVPKPSIIQPGPAWLFVTINGIPSVGVQVNVGSGTIEEQVVDTPEALPASSELNQKPNETVPGSDATTIHNVKAMGALLAAAFASFLLWA